MYVVRRSAPAIGSNHSIQLKYVVGIISNCLLTGLARTVSPLPIGDSCRGMWHRARLIGLASSYDKDRFVYAEGLP
jgi:hypothetical protein